MSAIKIPLGYIKGDPVERFALIDEEDVPLVEPYQWRASPNKGRSFYAYTKAHSPVLMMHRLILGAGPGEIVDHVNRDTLDNTRANLRIVTAAENAKNQRRRVTNMSGVKGVSWHKTNKRWQAYVYADGKHYHLGSFKSIRDAAEARRVKALELFGAFVGDEGVLEG